MSSFSMKAVLSLIDNLTNPYKKSANRITSINSTLGGSFGKLNAGIDRAMIGATKAVGVGLTAGVTLATVALKKLTDQAGKIENATASFTPLMGGVEKATELVERLNKEAATTPFQFEGIASIAKQLLPVMNSSIEDTANSFRMLGDTAGGDIQKLESITRGYTKALLKGKPDMEALNMISEAGVPIFTEMAKSMGVSVDQLFELSKQGKLTNEQLTQTFKDMTSEGGLFFKGMEISSQTLTGKLSTMRDNIALLGAKLGTALLPYIKTATDYVTELAQKLTKWAEENEGLMAQKLDETVLRIKDSVVKMIEVFKTAKDVISSVSTFISEHKGFIEGLIVTLGAFKLAVIAVNTVQAIQMGLMAVAPLLGFIKALASLAKTEGILATAQYALNIAMTANPIGLIIVGVAALIAIIILLVKNFDKVKAAVINVWDIFMKLLDNPLIAGAAVILAPWIAIPALIIKNWDKLVPVFEVVGRAIMTYLLTPINLVVSAISFLLGAINKIPGIKGKLDGALANLEKFQNTINTVTLLGQDRTGSEDTQAQGVTPSTASSIESHLAIQKEKSEKDKETKQRYDINLNAPQGYSMELDGLSPALSVALGGQ